MNYESVEDSELKQKLKLYEQYEKTLQELIDLHDPSRMNWVDRFLYYNSHKITILIFICLGIIFAQLFLLVG